MSTLEDLETKKHCADVATKRGMPSKIYGVCGFFYAWKLYQRCWINTQASRHNIQTQAPVQVAVSQRAKDSRR